MAPQFEDQEPSSAETSTATTADQEPSSAETSSSATIAEERESLKPAATIAKDAATTQTTWEDVAIESFDRMGLRDELLRGIYAYGFEKPSAIQQRAITPMLSGRDVIAQAQSGTGKTATFAIGILNQIDVSLRACQALILAPTRELAGQIMKVVVALGDFMLSLQIHACVGGSSVRDDIRKLQQGVHVVVGTPGRVADMIGRRSLAMDSVQLFALDEADEMLASGFKDQLYDVFKFLPEDVRVALFSATMPLEILDITNRFMQDRSVSSSSVTS